jgi:hypothetical protein
MANASVVHCVFRSGDVGSGRVAIIGRYRDYGIAKAQAHKLTNATGILHEVEISMAIWGPAMSAQCELIFDE